MISIIAAAKQLVELLGHAIARSEQRRGRRRARSTLEQTAFSVWAAARRAPEGHAAAERLPEITAPTLFIAGQPDRSTPPVLPRTIAHVIAGAAFGRARTLRSGAIAALDLETRARGSTSPIPGRMVRQLGCESLDDDQLV